MAIKDIIRKRREELDLTYEELGEKVGVGKSTVRKWETGMIENIKRSNIAALAKALEISPSLLMGWETKDEYESGENSSDNSFVGEKIAEYSAFKLNSDFIEIPIVGSIRAGQPMLADDNICGYIPVLSGSLKNDSDYFGLMVKGDSMNLEFKEGTILVVEKTPCIENNEIGIVRIDGLEATVKKVIISGEMITLIPCSSNPEHIPHMYNIKDDDIEIIGKVKQAIKTY